MNGLLFGWRIAGVGGVFLRCVHAGAGEIVRDLHVNDAIGVGAKYVARVGGDGSIEKDSNELLADEERMAVMAVILRRDGPKIAVAGAVEGFAEQRERSGRERRTIDGRDHGCVAAMIDSSAKADLQRAELTAARIEIAGHVSGAGADGVGDGVRIFSSDDDDGSRVRLERENGCGEQRGVRS